MCLYIDSSSNARTADDDIHVWKIISTSNESEYFHFKYEKNTTYKTTMRSAVRKMERLVCDGGRVPYMTWHVVENGFHAYTYKPKIIHGNTYDSFLVAGVVVLTDVPDKFKIVEFVIPKGATYYTGTLYDIVSDEITSGSLDSAPVQLHTSTISTVECDRREEPGHERRL